MTQKQLEVQNRFEGLFVPLSGGREGVCFAKNVMGTPEQEAISKVMQESGLSFDFSYQIAEKAVNVLIEIDWNDDDAITEAVDAAVPVYNGELVEIYKNDAHAVDEAIEQFGENKDADSIKRAALGWYCAIDNMVREIILKLL